MPKLTLRYVVAAVREALTADGNWNGERLWQGRTDNELLLVVEGAKKRPGGWLLRWQYIDAVGELQQYRLDVLTTAELQAALVVVKQHAELAVPFGNPFPDLGEKSAKDPLLELVKRLAHEHKNVEDEKGSRQPSPVHGDRQLPARRRAALGQSVVPALEPGRADLPELGGGNSSRRSPVLSGAANQSGGGGFDSSEEDPLLRDFGAQG